MVELKAPPLRSRVEDIPEFIDFFSSRFAAKYDAEVWRPSAEELHRFCTYDWPGNIRQLSHVIEQSYVLNCPPTLPSHSVAAEDRANLPFLDLELLRRAAVKQALRTTKGHKGHAARLLGVHVNTMSRLASRLLRSPDPADKPRGESDRSR